MVIQKDSAIYPSSLLKLHSPPKELYVEGAEWETLIQQPMLAVVGTRRPSHYGAALCRQIVQEIAVRGVVIVSGLALGIDSIAHKAALEVGGRTIAVVPAGLDTIYPVTHRPLAKAITEYGGALISEYPMSTKIAHKSQFVARTRIIAGLSNAVFIPEATAKGGTLHTARFAIDSGIDVCALPGHVTNPMAEGCHNLIKTGAALVTSADDILQLFHIAGQACAVKPKGSTTQEQQLIDLLASGVYDSDDLLNASKLSATEYNQALTMLELNGIIQPTGGNTWMLVRYY